MSRVHPGRQPHRGPALQRAVALLLLVCLPLYTCSGVLLGLLGPAHRHLAAHRALATSPAPAPAHAHLHADGRLHLQDDLAGPFDGRDLPRLVQQLIGSEAQSVWQAAHARLTPATAPSPAPVAAGMYDRALRAAVAGLPASLGERGPALPTAAAAAAAAEPSAPDPARAQAAAHTRYEHHHHAPGTAGIEALGASDVASLLDLAAAGGAMLVFLPQAASAQVAAAALPAAWPAPVAERWFSAIHAQPDRPPRA